MNIGYHDNFGSRAAAPCWNGVADWENAQKNTPQPAAKCWICGLQINFRQPEMAATTKGNQK